ncbi:MAG: TraB/GumN family protein [Chitinophagaceae bacterium]|nr:TraB/GumN family protein [Chitinophagaceae bacterium]
MRILILFALLLPHLVEAQIPRIKNKKYQGLLWEISGNGLSKPSYLFGTMHVSNKLAFHLADSFYLGIRNADVVALETNPETWQDDMDKYNKAIYAADKTAPGTRFLNQSDYLRISTLKFYRYDKKIETALQSNPSMINSLLYRSYSNTASDFEEDTYLDLYIYQCGKRWGKKVAGVEDYEESVLLVAEAYRDANNDKSKKVAKL